MSIFKKDEKNKKQEDLNEKRWSSRRLFNQIARFIGTKRPGPNMPKRQPCPNGHGWMPRQQKTENGAYYFCHVESWSFLVLHPKAKAESLTILGE